MSAFDAMVVADYNERGPRPERKPLDVPVPPKGPPELNNPDGTPRIGGCGLLMGSLPCRERYADPEGFDESCVDCDAYCALADQQANGGSQKKSEDGHEENS